MKPSKEQSSESPDYSEKALSFGNDLVVQDALRVENASRCRARGRGWSLFSVRIRYPLKWLTRINSAHLCCRRFARQDHADCHSGRSPIARSASRSRRDLGFDDVTDQSLGPFDEGQMVAEATLKQHADTMVTGNVGGRHQRNVFRRSQVA